MAMDPNSGPSGAQATQSSGDDMTVPVSKPQRELLNSNEVMEKFLSMLQDNGITAEQKSLYTESIIVVQGDPQIAKQCLASVICTDSLTFETSRKTETLSCLSGLQNRFRGKFAVHFTEARAEVAFRPCIQREVTSILDDLKNAVKFVPLPSYMVDFLQNCLRSFTVKFNSNFRSPVDLSIVTDPENHQPCLKLRCEQAALPEAERVLEKNLTQIFYTVQKVDRPRGNYLQSSAGRRLVREAENSSSCTMSVQTPSERVLLVTRSPRGHQVMVCEGNMATTDCDLLVLPLWDGQEEWPPSYQCILQRGCLSTNVRDYLKRVGVPPKPMTLTLRCQESAPGQSVVIMYVPQLSHGSFQDMVFEAVKEAITSARNARSGLALPLTLRGDVSFDVIKRILSAAVHSFSDNNLPPVTKFYLDPGAAWPGDIGSVFQEHNWTCEMMTDPVDAIFDQRVKVTIGDIMSAEGDAVVNSTDPRLQHTGGQVSRVLLRECGPDLVTQCRQRYPSGMADHVVAITDAVMLRQFKHIFHVTLPQTYWDPSEASELLQALRTRVEACLFLATVKGLNSIVFPALATGQLRYPADVEARTVLAASREFFSRMPHSSLTRVNFVTYQRNPVVVKEFKAEEAVNRYSLHRLPDRGKAERRFQLKNTLVQVVQGDAMTRQCSAQLLICADPPTTGRLQDYRSQAGGDCAVETVGQGSPMKNQIRNILKGTAFASVQLNMQTFDAGQTAQLVASIYNGLRYTQTVQIMVIVVSSPDTFLRLCSTLARSYRSPNGGGGVRSRDQDQACVAICGCLRDTEKAIKKILEIEVPDKYEQGDRDSLHPRFLESADSEPQARAAVSSGAAGQTMPMAAAADSASTGPSQQDQEAPMVTVPREQLRGAEGTILEAFERLNVNVSFRGQDVRFTADHSDEPQLRACVHSTLIGLLPTMVPTASPAYARTVSIPSTFLTQEANSSQDKNIFGVEKNDGERDLQPEASARDATRSQSADVSNIESVADLSGSPRSDVGSTAMAALEGEALAFLKDHQSRGANSLRQEEIILTTQEIAKLGTSIDFKSQGIAAYAKILPDLQKVIIFALDYETLTKAKHMVNVKTGKTTLRSKLRSKEKANWTSSSAYNDRGSLTTQSAVPVTAGSVEMALFSKSQGPTLTQSENAVTEAARQTGQHTSQVEGQTGEGASSGKRVNGRQFVNKGGLTVQVYTADITTLPVDAIVNAAHEKLIHRGGVAAVIASAAGQSLQDEGNKYVTEHGPLKVMEVVVTTAGALPCQKVLHALGPRWDCYSDKMLCQQHLAQTIFNCLQTAHRMAFTSVAFSSVSSATFGVPRQVCAESYRSGVMDFEDKYGKSTSVQHIHFVDINEDMVSLVQDTFAACWSDQ